MRRKNWIGARTRGLLGVWEGSPLSVGKGAIGEEGGGGGDGGGGQRWSDGELSSFIKDFRKVYSRLRNHKKVIN